MDVEIANQLFSTLAVIAQVMVVILILALIFWKKVGRKSRRILEKYATLFAFMVALVATLGSLYYSEIAGYTPCKLCWYQRILMYPQVLLLGMAYLKKDKHIFDYSILLSSLGAGIAFYHYLIQRGTIGEILPCAAVGYSVSCAEKFVMMYGYITIPFMAFSGFLLILFLMIAQKKINKKAA